MKTFLIFIIINHKMRVDSVDMWENIDDSLLINLVQE